MDLLPESPQPCHLSIERTSNFPSSLIVCNGHFLLIRKTKCFSSIISHSHTSSVDHRVSHYAPLAFWPQSTSSRSTHVEHWICNQRPKSYHTQNLKPLLLGSFHLGVFMSTFLSGINWYCCQQLFLFEPLFSVHKLFLVPVFKFLLFFYSSHMTPSLSITCKCFRIEKFSCPSCQMFSCWIYFWSNACAHVNLLCTFKPTAGSPDDVGA